jgi:hypothetical protein
MISPKINSTAYESKLVVLRDIKTQNQTVFYIRNYYKNTLKKQTCKLVKF